MNDTKPNLPFPDIPFHSAVLPEAMQAEITNRAGGHEHAPGEEHDAAAAVPGATDSAPEHQHDDSTTADSTAAKPAHTHAPGTPPHKD